MSFSTVFKFVLGLHELNRGPVKSRSLLRTLPDFGRNEIDSPENAKKKTVSWNSEEYLSKVKLEKIKEKPCLLERKSSLGPCFLSAGPFGRPSGIAICLSKKCCKIPEVEEYQPGKSMINISLSKRRLVNKTIDRCPTDVSEFIKKKKSTIIPIPENPKGNATLKEKISSLSDKIKNLFG